MKIINQQSISFGIHESLIINRIIVMLLIITIIFESTLPSIAFAQEASLIPAPTESSPTTSPTPLPAGPAGAATLPKEKTSPIIVNDTTPLTQTSSEIFNLDHSNIGQESAAFKAPAVLRSLLRRNFKAGEKVKLTVANADINNFTTTIKYADGSIVDLPTQEIKNGNDTQIQLDPPRAFKPGKYKAVVTINGRTFEQDFSWGVLAINTNKSIYLPNETAKLAIAVLDDKGEMICDANLVLKIRDPGSTVSAELSTANGQIKSSPTCTQKAMILEADYGAAYKVSGAGNYNMTLSATTSNGTHTIDDAFEVRESVDFDIERVTATRLYPPETYPVTFKMKANRDFKGTVVEIVPENFGIFQLEGALNYRETKVSDDETLEKEEVLGASTIGYPFEGDESISQGFGEPIRDPKMKKLYYDFGVAGHDGIDFGLDEGTQVIAVDDGDVVMADANGVYGSTIVIEHVWGKSYYGHLSKFQVKKNQKVVKGEKIALSGSTGLSLGPHLHFGIKLNENNFENGFYGKINPAPFLGIHNEENVLGVSATSQTFQVISWDISVKKGEEITFGYKFKSPNISPQLYRIGALKLFESGKFGPVFEEARQWQLAVDSVVTSGGITEAETQFGGLQKKVVYASNNWYAFYNDGGDVFYKKSSDGTTWGSAVDIDTGDADNYNPSVWLEGAKIYVVWLDDGDDDFEVNTIDTAAADALGTKCASAIAGPPSLGTAMTHSITVTDDGTVYFASSDTATDTEAYVFKLVFAGCTFTDITTGSGLTAGDRPVIVSNTNTINLIFQDGNLSRSIYEGTSWAVSNTTVAAVTNNIYDVTTDGTNVWALQVSGTTATRLDTYASPIYTDVDISGGAGSSDNRYINSIFCLSATDCKIAYFDGGAGDISFIDCDNADCSTKTVTTLDTDVGTNPTVSIYCPSATDCKVVYFDRTDGDITFADCDDATCSTTNCNTVNANCTDIDTVAGLAGQASIYCPANDGGDCKVVYYDQADQDVTFVDCFNDACSGVNTIITDIDTAVGNTINGRTAIDCPSATDCKVVYFDGVDGDVTFVDCSNATCSTQDTGSPVDIDTDAASAAVSLFCSASDDCKVAYFDGTDADITFVDCDTSTCGTSTITDIDIDVGTAGKPSIYCPSATDCKVVYFDSTDTDITFADCNDATCSAPTITDVDDQAGTLAYASIYCPSATDCKVVEYDHGDADDTFIDCGDGTCSSPSNLTAPWTGQTNLTSVAITYDSTNSDLYAHVIKDTSEQAYYKSTDATTISWGSETSYAFTAGDLGHISSNMTGAQVVGVVLRQGSNFEFAQVTFGGVTPTNDQLMRHGKWFNSGAEQPFTF